MGCPCVANGRIAAEGPFDEVFVQPAAGDAGGALGAALWATHVVHRLPRKGALTTAFLGAAYAQEDIARFLRDCGVLHRAVHPLPRQLRPQRRQPGAAFRLARDVKLDCQHTCRVAGHKGQPARELRLTTTEVQQRLVHQLHG